MMLEYRFATDADLDVLAEWNHQLIRDEGHRNAMTVPELRERMREWLQGTYRAVLFSEEDEAAAYELYSENETNIYLRQFFVARNRRRRGIGRRAMGILRNQLWPRYKRLTVGVLTTNEPALAFWQALGYKEYCLLLEIMPGENTE